MRDLSLPTWNEYHGQAVLSTHDSKVVIMVAAVDSDGDDLWIRGDEKASMRIAQEIKNRLVGIMD